MSDILIAGVDFSGASKTPNETWLAQGRMGGWQFELTEVRKVGSHMLAAELPRIKYGAVGIDCPFSLPLKFAEFLAHSALKQEFQSWQDMAEHLVFMTFEDFKAAAVEFKTEPKRLTDKQVKTPAQSPLHRGNPSMIQMTFHGIKLLASLDPSKFAVLPFQDPSAERTAVIEVYPRDTLQHLELPDTGYKTKTKADAEQVAETRRKIISGLINLRDRKQITYKDYVRLSCSNQLLSQLVANDHALDAVVAAYTTAMFVAHPNLFGDPLSLDNLDVLIEGWIYAFDR